MDVVVTAVAAAVRKVCWKRDAGRCVKCGATLWPSYSLHHRRARGMGGSRRLDTNGPANLIYLCGHGTSPDGCHAWVESKRTEAYLCGLLVHQAHNPADVAVLTWRGWLMLTDDGGYVPQEARTG